ncbi:MAG TPA: 50S ribosomal protein L11 methyltransferase [Gemmatimonadaceae bacterium]|nr:50S ribosomal protein L11 methyltransferase [Gemmatimonadaceae bacterium]
MPDAADAQAAAPSWVSVRVEVEAPAEASAAARVLFEAGAAGVQEIGNVLATYLPSTADLDAVRAMMSREARHARMHCEPAPDAGRAERWAPRVGVQRVGRLTVAPPWLAETSDAEGGVIIIDPAMAFGTGEHPTTRGVLRLMQRIVHGGDRVADLGAGSAILSIAAARLGAAWVAAIERDEDAIGNAESNVERNGVGDRVTVVHGDAGVLLPLVAPVQLIMANLFSSVLVRLSPAMREALAPGGHAIVSGVLLDERDQLLEAMDGDGWALDADDTEAEWWSGVLHPQ